VDIAFFEVVKSTCAVWLLLTAFALGTEKPSLLLGMVVALNASGLALTSHGQVMLRAAQAVCGACRPHTGLTRLPRSRGQLAFSMTGFVLAASAAVCCGVKTALLQTVLQEGADTMER
jgi:hypothetical protein